MTKKQHLLNMLSQRWMTPHDALRICGLFSLSQRCGELRREGHNVISRRVKGASYHTYRVIG